MGVRWLVLVVFMALGCGQQIPVEIEEPLAPTEESEAGPSGFQSVEQQSSGEQGRVEGETPPRDDGFPEIDPELPPDDPRRDPRTDPDDPRNDPSPEEGSCEAPAIDTLEPCCEDAAAHCVPSDGVADGFEAKLAECDSGGVCVPDIFLTSGEAHQPTPCVSIGGAEGVCMSVCVPEVGSFQDVLPQTICGPGDRCTPCIHPLTGVDTQLCGGLNCLIGEDAGPETPNPDPEPELPAASCDNPPTEPTIDVNIFPQCCDGAHCVPLGFIPADLQSMLDSCDGGAGLCVPDPLVAYAGFFTPPACELAGGLEGRCLSTCLPGVAEQMDLAPQATCASNERCIPCCDPFTGEDTLSCSIGCDTGPPDGVCAPVYTECCDGAGHCIPSELVPPDQAENLDDKECQEASLCVPDQLKDPNFVALQCSGEIPFVGAYQGVCLSKCLKIPLDFLIWSGTCPKTDDCVPCFDPLSGSPTDAPGC